MKPKPAEIEQLLCGQRYVSESEAIAAAQAVACHAMDFGDEIHVHSDTCEIDGPDERCTCQPVIVVHREELASA